MTQEAYQNNHYVPIWYQKRFVPDARTQHELLCLDLNPPSFFDRQGRAHKGNPVRRLGYRHCFAEDDLYTTNFHGIESREIEKLFFGTIDTKGRDAVDWCERFSYPWDGTNRANDLLMYMTTQKLRTPKGLAWLQQQTRKAGGHDRNNLLALMTQLRQLYGSVWMECVWLIADASKSETKFIVSDHPVTVYNRRCGPRSDFCKGANDPDIRLHGTHTIFPLSLEKVLILTNLSWVRNPYQNELEVRPNPNFFRGAIMNMHDIQMLSHLSEEEVRQLNFIIKSRAYRYVAAAREDWLYPERYISKSDWAKFGHGYLCMPDPRGVQYGGEVMIGFNDGTATAFDEYGRRPGQAGFRVGRSGVGADWTTFLRFQGEFARLFGPLRRGRAFNAMMLDNERDEDEYHQYHLRLEKEQRG